MVSGTMFGAYNMGLHATLMVWCCAKHNLQGLLENDGHAPHEIPCEGKI